MSVAMVRMKVLAQLLRVSSRACYECAKAGEIVEHSRVKRQLSYTAGSVDAFLARHWISYEDDPCPNVEDLISQRTRLIKTDEAFAQAARALGIDSMRMFLLFIQSGGFGGYLKLRGRIRLVEASVSRKVTLAEGVLSRLATERVFGCGHVPLKQLADKHGIETVSPRGSRLTCYRIEDVVRLLVEGSILPDWIDPHFWIKDALRAKPITTTEAVNELGIPIQDVLDAMERRELCYITLVRGYRISLSSVRVLFLAQTPLAMQEIAHIWGATPPEVEDWLKEGQLWCPLHNHASGLAYRRACIVQMLGPALSPGVTSQQWFVSRQKAQFILVPEEVVRERHGISHSDIDGMARQGVITGLCRPDGRWMFGTKIRRLKSTEILAYKAAQEVR